MALHHIMLGTNLWLKHLQTTILTLLHQLSHKVLIFLVCTKRTNICVCLGMFIIENIIADAHQMLWLDTLPYMMKDHWLLCTLISHVSARHQILPCMVMLCHLLIYVVFIVTILIYWCWHYIHHFHMFIFLAANVGTPLLLSYQGLIILTLHILA